MVFCGVAIKQRSSTQATVALSSGEVGYIILVRAASEGLAVQSLARDLGWSYPGVLHTDSSAVKGVASRSGAGRIRHIECRVLWVQEAVKLGRLRLEKVAGTENPADVLTKPCSAAELAALLQ